MIKSIYLAGPDVFLPDAVEVGRKKVALCERYGFEGLFPLDNEMGIPGNDPRKLGYEIYAANAEMMHKADAILANLTPFRGPSADIGTAFEVGFFAALDRPIFAYSSDARDLAERTRAGLSLEKSEMADRDGLAIEMFELPENLMLPGAVQASGGSWIAESGEDAPDIRAFKAYEKALVAMRAFADNSTASAIASG